MIYQIDPGKFIANLWQATKNKINESEIYTLFFFYQTFR